MSSSSTNIAGHADWWELTNLGPFPVNLKGFRFDDNSETLAAAFTFTNDVTMATNEAIVFVEGMTPDEFRAWWGPENLLPNLQVITYRGNGLSSIRASFGLQTRKRIPTISVSFGSIADAGRVVRTQDSRQ
jgi:hypothetical protein